MNNVPPEAVYTSFAAAGGAANYLHKYAHGGKFHIGIFIASMAMSGFSGLMFAYVGIWMNFPQSGLFVCAGIGGFLGHAGLEWLANLLKDRIIR